MNEPADQTWILQRERGEDVSHIAAGTRAGYDRLAALIEALPEETPEPGWKRRIFASLDEPSPRGIAAASRHRTRHRVALVAGGLATAAAIAIILAWCNRATDERPPEVAINSVAGKFMAAPLATTVIRRSDTPHRSSEGASIGDTLVLSLEVDRAGELRVYGDAGEPLARCTETHGCTVERSGKIRRFQLELVLRASGTVRAVLFTGDSIPGSFQNLNADVETAQQADVDARQVAFVHVQ